MTHHFAKREDILKRIVERYGRHSNNARLSKIRNDASRNHVIEQLAFAPRDVH